MKQPLLLFAITILSQFGFSQQHEIDYGNVRDGESVEYCRTHKEMKKFLLNPAYMKLYAADQAMLKAREEQMAQEKSTRGTVYTFPVVFHILHDGGNENISREQIEDAMAILNRDYRLQNIDANNVASAFQGMPSDVEIEFKLATKAPNGACFSGVTRTQNALTFDGSGGTFLPGTPQVDAIVAGNDIFQGTWPGDEYLNIYVVAEADGAAGYTTNPNSWSASSMYNGIWILHNYTGSIGTSSSFRSRALTHEVGHWLNLSHTWGPNNNPGNSASCSDDDQVTDTPNTVGVTSCSLTESTCGPLANVENYMDYSYCSKMFTAGQATRMRAATTSSIRSNHWSATNLTNVGAVANPPFCAANFFAERYTICEGETLNFTDDSYNGTVTGWDWTFTGGTPAVSTDQNPAIVYDTPGTYAVSLTATDGSTSFSETKNTYITVLPSTGINLPIYEGFENATSIPNADWYVENPNNDVAWQITTTASATGGKSIRLNNYSNNEDGELDELVSHAFDLSNMASVTMTFNYAFSKKNSSVNSDKLQVLASDDCGATWAVRKSIATSQLPTNGGAIVQSTFVPAADEWKEISVTSLVGSYLADRLRFKFVFTSGGGNDIYIDDINIYGTDTTGNQVGSPTIITEFISNDAVNVYPNPADDNISISIDLSNREDILSVGVYDLLGKKVLSVYEGSEIAGQHIYNASTKDLSTGMYLVLINNGKNSVSQKLIVK